jgi:hypothetical protein
MRKASDFRYSMRAACTCSLAGSPRCGSLRCRPSARSPGSRCSQSGCNEFPEQRGLTSSGTAYERCTAPKPEKLTSRQPARQTSNTQRASTFSRLGAGGRDGSAYPDLADQHPEDGVALVVPHSFGDEVGRLVVEDRNDDRLIDELPFEPGPGLVRFLGLARL